MSMATFQKAFAALAASPRLCVAVRDEPEAALAHFDLDERERRRLASAARQRGMDANCMLYRATRITPLTKAAPLTMDLLRPVLRPILDAYWEDCPVHEVRFVRETARFIEWLAAHPDGLPEPADDIITIARRELAAAEARQAAQ
jgi:hypothetical protein